MYNEAFEREADEYALKRVSVKEALETLQDLSDRLVVSDLLPEQVLKTSKLDLTVRMLNISKMGA